MTASLLHIIDEIDWGLIPELSGKKTAISIMKTLPELIETEGLPDYDEIFSERDSITENWIRITSWCIKRTPGASS
jgi:adenosylcobinamide hydrolase